MRVLYKGKTDWDLTKGNIYKVYEKRRDCYTVIDDVRERNDVDFRYCTLIDEETKTPEHYDNTNGSLYQFAEDHKLNSYEFDIIKRIIRCRKKGEFLSDLNKTKNVIDIYIKEQTKM